MKRKKMGHKAMLRPEEGCTFLGKEGPLGSYTSGKVTTYLGSYTCCKQIFEDIFFIPIGPAGVYMLHTLQL